MKSMTSKLFLFTLGLLLLFPVMTDRCMAQDAHQLNLSVTLSGHIFIGLGYNYQFDERWQVGCTFHFAPEHGLPSAVSAGGGYVGKGQDWRASWRSEFMLLVSPPDPQKRKAMAMINIVPGVIYAPDNDNQYTSEIWVSYLPTRKKVAPTGLEFQYGRNL